jgi:hypothetical protein
MKSKRSFANQIKADSRTSRELAAHLAKHCPFPVSHRTIETWRTGRDEPPAWKQQMVLDALR